MEEECSSVGGRHVSAYIQKQLIKHGPQMILRFWEIPTPHVRQDPIQL